MVFNELFYNTFFLQQNQIDMNRQSDMMAAFEENIIWSKSACVSKMVITLTLFVSTCDQPASFRSKGKVVTTVPHFVSGGLATIWGQFQDSVSIYCHMCACMYVNVITYVHICITFIHTAENVVSKLSWPRNSLPLWTVANIVIRNQ